MTTFNGMDNKKLIIFDLDETLAESKNSIDAEMSNLLFNLLQKKLVAVISGGAFNQFQKQFLNNLNCPVALLFKMYLLPTSGSSFWIYNKEKNDWQVIYKEIIPESDKQKIKESINQAVKESGVGVPEKSFGERIEDRETQMSFSALGQNAPIEMKKKWDSDQKKRERIIQILKNYLPNYDIKFGGTTTIDITKSGMDKAYGVKRMAEYLKIPLSEMLFVADKLQKNGNDYPVKALGVKSIAVKNPEETKKVIIDLLNQSQ